MREPEGDRLELSPGWVAMTEEVERVLGADLIAKINAIRPRRRRWNPFRHRDRVNPGGSWWM